MATDPNEVGGMGGWVIDPANPNRATYTDEYGDVYEVFKDEAIAPVEGVEGAPAPQEMVRPSVVMGTAPTDTAPRVLPTPKVATTIKFGDEINALDNNVWKNKAAEAASVFDQLMADPTRTEDEIRKYVADSGYAVQNLDENLADRAAGKRTKNAVVDSKFNDPLGQLDQPIEKIEPGDRGGWDRFSDYFTSESQRGFQGILRRTWDDWANTGKDQLREQFPGMDEEWYEAMSELTSRVGQKAIIQEVEARNKMDPLWQPDETLVEAALSINRWAPALIGSMAGSAGPETFFAPGKTAVSRILNQGLISGGSRLGYNSVDYLQGISEDLDLQSVFADVLIGGATQGVFEVPGAVKELFKARGRDTTPGADPREPAPTFGEDTAKIVEEAAVKQIIDGIDPKLKPKLSARYIERATDKVNEITADWQNAPSIKIARDEAEIEEALGYTIDPDAVGVVLPDGTVAINMKNVDSEETLTAAVFHEGLGHHGLTQQFGEALDATLDDLYAGSTWFQRQVDDWMQRNPDAYGDDLNPRARAAEEVLAEMSEAGRMPPALWQRIERVVREFARKFMNVDINEREIGVILDMAHDATINGMRNDVVGNGFRYMKKRTQGPGSEGMLQGGSRRDFENVETETNLGLGRFRSKENIEPILKQVQEERLPEFTKEGWNDWLDEAADIRNKAKVAKNLKAGSSAPEILAAREAIVKSANRIAQLSRKAADMTLSPKEEYYLFAEMARNADMQDALAGVRSNAARIVNSFRISVETDESFTDAIRNMMKNVNNTVLSDPANRAQLLKQLAENVDNPDAINRLSKAVFTPKAEEYIFRVWYNMLLSSPGTHEVNFLGTGANFMYDLLENTGAAILGQGKRFSNADRIRGREVAYRMWGALRALTTASTWKNAAKSFDTGLTGNIPNAKTDNSNVYTGDNKGIKAASYVLEGPTRALAGADEWWRNVLQLSNIYGLAVRNAGNKGLKGKAFWKEVDNLINAPTKEMIDATLDYTKVLQFLDKPSALAQTIINAQTPKVNDGAVNRIGRGILKVAVPFVRTPDALIRTAIRRSGFLSPLERENIAGWKAGGADKDKVKARMIMGGALAFFVASQVYNGTITGAGPSDFRKKMEWLGSHQENSIKVGDEWYSIQGLEPVSTNISAIATLVERYKSGELTDEEYAKSALTATHGLATVLVDNSYLENMTNLVDIFGGDPDQAQNALNNFLVGIGASITTPAILRSYTQSQDPAIRDTTGDGSFTDRLQGRIDSGVPGLSDKLPQKYDVYGRPMTKETYDVAGRLRSKDEETDPVIIELSRLSDTTDKVIVGAPKKTGISVNGSEPRRLTAEEFQAYQQLSGYWIVESVRQEMATPEWEEMTDEERIELVNDIKKDMRANAREELFGGEVDDEEEE